GPSNRAVLLPEGTGRPRSAVGRRGEVDAGAAGLFEPEIVNKEPLVIVVFLIEFFDPGPLAGAGNADDLASADRLTGADVFRGERSQPTAGARLVWLRLLSAGRERRRSVVCRRIAARISAQAAIAC